MGDSIGSDDIMTDDERIQVTNEFIDIGGHAVPRNRRMKCARCEKWMTIDQLLPRQECPHCRETLVLDAVARPITDQGSGGRT